MSATGEKATWSHTLTNSAIDSERTIGAQRLGPIVWAFSLTAPPQSATLSASMRRFLRGLNETARVHCRHRRYDDMAGDGACAATAKSTARECPAARLSVKSIQPGAPCGLPPGLARRRPP